jgi:hypothetical protein
MLVHNSILVDAMMQLIYLRSIHNAPFAFLHYPPPNTASLLYNKAIAPKSLVFSGDSTSRRHLPATNTGSVTRTANDT